MAKYRETIDMKKQRGREMEKLKPPGNDNFTQCKLRALVYISRTREDWDPGKAQLSGCLHVIGNCVAGLQPEILT